MPPDSRSPRADAEFRLIEGLRRGDRAAVDALVRRYRAQVYRLARDFCPSESDAEEVVQDVLVSVVRKIQTFQAKSTLWSWIFRIATRAALMKRRGKRREVEVALEDHLPGFLKDGYRGDAMFLTRFELPATPEAALLRSEELRLLVRAIDGLPGPYRAVLTLHGIEGLTNDSVARAVGESVRCVKSRLHRARKALREELAWYRESDRGPTGQPAEGRGEGS